MGLDLLVPKKFKAPLRDSYAMADELKVIVYNDHDLTWAAQEAAKVRPECRLFIQPEYSVFSKVIMPIVDHVKSNPAWTISLQTHKVIQIP